MAVATGEIYNAVVSVGGGKVYTAEIDNQKRGGFRVSYAANQPGAGGSEDLVAALSLESYDPDNGWQPEPTAVFNGHPAGVAFKSLDTFTDTQAERYRIGIDPSAGDGKVVVNVSMQTEE